MDNRGIKSVRQLILGARLLAPLPYFNYSVLKTQTREFNLQNFNIFDFGAY